MQDVCALQKESPSEKTDRVTQRKQIYDPRRSFHSKAGKENLHEIEAKKQIAIKWPKDNRSVNTIFSKIRADGTSPEKRRKGVNRYFWASQFSQIWKAVRRLRQNWKSIFISSSSLQSSSFIFRLKPISNVSNSKIKKITRRKRISEQ